MSRVIVTTDPRNGRFANVAKQLRYAGSLALNETAKRLKTDAETRINRVFDKPTPFTQRGVAVLYANRNNLRASVIVKDAQARYLAIQEAGGERIPAKRALIVPVAARRNQYGNLSRNQVRTLLARRDTFSGEVRGVGGIWQRQRKGGLKLLIAYEPRARYTRRFGFVDGARREAMRIFPAQYRLAIARALATAR